MSAIRQELPRSGEAVNFQDPRHYLNRELSWLRFNDRVLHEASDARTPLLERLKFLAIFSSNLDEFFMVRVSGLMEQLEAGVDPRNPDGFSPGEQLEAVHEHLLVKVTEQHHLFESELRPALAAEGILLLDYPELNAEQCRILKNYFEEHIFPVLTPLSVDPAHPFPQMSNLSLNFAVVVEDPETGIERFARVYSRHDAYRKLLVVPLTLRPRMQGLIEREIQHARNGDGGRIIAKMNSLVDADMIRLLYEASQAGVQIDLVIRGICCLRPGVPGVSENIRVISVIGRYLEHSRIFYFENRGQEEVYIGSADWMTRNLDRRVEAMVPIENASLKQELKTVLTILLKDNRQAWDMCPDGQYIQRRPASGEEERASQNLLMARALANH